MAPQMHDLVGEWRLMRAITPAAGSAGRFEGRASFTPEGAGLRYFETGLLSLDGVAPVRAERGYLWQAEGAEIVVRFADGRAFHRFSPDAPEAAHWCDPDDYRVRYDFSLWPAWTARWQVKGPRKDYTMLSHYSRG